MPAHAGGQNDHQFLSYYAMPYLFASRALFGWKGFPPIGHISDFPVSQRTEHRSALRDPASYHSIITPHVGLPRGCFCRLLRPIITTGRRPKWNERWKSRKINLHQDGAPSNRFNHVLTPDLFIEFFLLGKSACPVS